MSLFIPALTPALDQNGKTISGATWSFYRSGTSEALAVYSDSDLETELGAVVTADSAGRFVPIYLDDTETYRAKLSDDDGEVISDVDPYSDSGEFLQNFSGAVARNLTEKIRQDLPITPYDFGAIGFQPTTPYNPPTSRPTTGIPDDGAALQAWADAVSLLSSAGLTFEATGMFGTSVPIVIGPDDAYTAPRSLGGNLMLISLAPIARLTTWQNVDGWTWNGSLYFVGGGSTASYASRNVQTAMCFNDPSSSFVVTGSVKCVGFQFAGITIVTDDPVEIAEWLSIGGGLHGWDVGSAPVLSALTCAVSSTYSNRVNSGSAYSIGQRTTLDVGTNLPTFIDDYGTLTEQCVAVKIGDRPYIVTAYNRGAGTIEVYPWVETAAAASGTLYYIFGALFMEGGHDGSLANINEISGTRSNVWNCMSPYVSRVGHLTSQFGGADILMGHPSISQYGGELSGFYSEGGGSTSSFEMVMFNAGANRVAFGNLSMADFSKWFTPYAWDGASEQAQFGLVQNSVGNYQWEKKPNGGGILGGSEEIAIEANKPTAVFDPVDTFTLNVSAFDIHQDRMWGVRSRRVIIAGSGSNGQPTGTITIAPSASTRTGSITNGSAVVTGMTTTAALSAGMAVTGTGVPGGTTILSVNSATQITLSANATATNASASLSLLGKINGSANVTYSGLKTPLHVVITASPSTGNMTCQRLGTIPAAAMADVGAAPTQAEFNALLAKLRSNGTLAT